MDLAEAVALVTLAIMAAFVQAISGFGFSLFIVPMLAILIGPREAIVVTNALSLFNNSFTMVAMRSDINWRMFLILTPAAATGMPIGLLITRSVDPASMKIAIALVVLASTLLIWRGFRIRTQNLLLDVVAGLVSGVLNTTTSMNGPPVVLYMQGKQIAPSPFRSTLAAYFSASGLIAVAIFALDGQVTGLSLLRAAMAVPGILVGWAIGHRVFYRMGPERFRTVVIGVLFLSAIIALVTTLA